MNGDDKQVSWISPLNNNDKIRLKTQNYDKGLENIYFMICCYTHKELMIFEKKLHYL